MFDKNHLTGNGHLSAEAADAFEVRMVREKPELAEGIRQLQELLEPEVYTLLIVSGGIMQRTFLERDCIPALKEAFGVKRIQIIG